MTADDLRDARPATVMVVDDEEMVTRSIAGLLALESDYRVLTYQSPVAALDAARTEPLECVVSDFLMPDMDGLAFLTRLKELQPDVPAILLTGYADKESAIRAVNEIGLFQYLEKPWENDHLKLVIRNAVNSRTLTQALGHRLRELDRALKDRDTYRSSAEELDRELAMAEEVQRSILPKGPIDDPYFAFHHRYYPTGRLGGDFYDVVFTAPGRFNAIVADVTGHGAAAALVTMLVKVIFRDATEQGACCGAMLKVMNERLGRFLIGPLNVTAFALGIDATAGTVSAAAAGGPHPIVFESDGAAPAREWVLDGLPLGAFDNEVFGEPETVTRRLAFGERFLLYTDGLLDSTVDHGEPAHPLEIVRTVERLRNLDGETLLDELARARQIKGRVLPDDVNLLLVAMK